MNWKGRTILNVMQVSMLLVPFDPPPWTKYHEFILHKGTNQLSEMQIKAYDFGLVRNEIMF